MVLTQNKKTLILIVLNIPEVLQPVPVSIPGQKPAELEICLLLKASMLVIVNADFYLFLLL